MEIFSDHPLSKLTTIGTGGPAAAFARPESLAELEEAPRMGGGARPARRGRGARLEPARSGRRRRRARGPAGGRPRRRRGRRHHSPRGRRRDERGVPPPRPGCRPRRARVRLRDPGHRRRRRAHERGSVRVGLVGDPRARPRRLRRRERLVDPRRARPLLPALRAPAGPGRRARRVPADPAAGGGDQERGRRPRRAAQGDAADEQAHLRLGLQEPPRGARCRPDARAVRAEGIPDRRRRHLSTSTRTSSRTPTARPAWTASR